MRTSPLAPSSFLAIFLLSLLHLSAASSPTPAKSKSLPSHWSYIGCYTDDANNRLLQGAANASSIDYLADGDSMTGEKCVDFCAKSNYTLAGLEYGIQCFCARNFTGNFTDDNPAPKLDKDQCSMTCAGNDDEVCGGFYKLTVYENRDAGVQGGAGFVRAEVLSVVVVALGVALGLNGL